MFTFVVVVVVVVVMVVGAPRDAVDTGQRTFVECKTLNTDLM